MVTRCEVPNDRCGLGIEPDDLPMDLCSEALGRPMDCIAREEGVRPAPNMVPIEEFPSSRRLAVKPSERLVGLAGASAGRLSLRFVSYAESKRS
mmetsp:Transcript_28806/g.90798  ORF Transcript_28806/g.90798 Transcript_28806/m.90798 type:complete len:94 (+) Transcript_28806:411-692(+)